MGFQASMRWWRSPYSSISACRAFTPPSIACAGFIGVLRESAFLKRLRGNWLRRPVCARYLEMGRMDEDTLPFGTVTLVTLLRAGLDIHSQQRFSIWAKGRARTVCHARAGEAQRHRDDHLAVGMPRPSKQRDRRQHPHHRGRRQEQRCPPLPRVAPRRPDLPADMGDAEARSPILPGGLLGRGLAT